ncbi:MAG TPA: translation elongation factor Ts [Candidatus Limnocylindrales bacterium]|nr:translation elongation factor Ts [Candidatus Limnocylindrales bacterium]
MTTSPTISADQVKELRALTGAGFMDCKRALEASGGDVEGAVAYLREQGLAAAQKREGREAREGLVSSYIHTGGRIGVLIEVNCETDFVARTEEFQDLVRNLAIQVAGLDAQYPTLDSVPPEVLEAKRAELRADPQVQAKPSAIQDHIVEGQLTKWLSGAILTEQPFRDTEQTVGQLISEAIARTGENIKVRRFVRYELGGD